MDSLLGLELAKEINRDRLEAAVQWRAARQAHTTLFERVVRRARMYAAGTRMRPAPAPVSSAPMGCSA